MQQPVETARQENPHSPGRFERVLSVGTGLRERHYGQRSCVPHQQVEHTAAPTSTAELQEIPCQRRAVHTRRAVAVVETHTVGRSWPKVAGWREPASGASAKSPAAQTDPDQSAFVRERHPPAPFGSERAPWSDDPEENDLCARPMLQQNRSQRRQQ